MKSHIHLILGIVLLSFSLLSCSQPKDASKVDPKDIVSEYYIDYDTDTKILSVIAEFRAGTTYLTLDKGAYVSWDGELLEMALDSEINYIYYKLSKNITSDNELYTTHLFTYRNHEEKLFTHQITIPSVVDYSVTERTPVTLRMAWQIPDQIAADGLMVKKKKKLNSTIIKIDDFFIATEATQNSGTFFVPNSIVEKYGPGAAVDITVCRKRRFDLAEGTAGTGFLLARNCGKTISTTIPKE